LCNTGMYCADADDLRISTMNAQGQQRRNTTKAY
jgi:hypothetical protein